MTLVRTTLRLEKNLKKQAEKIALEKGITLQSMVNNALRNAIKPSKSKKKTDKVKFFDTKITRLPKNLTRNHFYENPK